MDPKAQLKEARAKMAALYGISDPNDAQLAEMAALLKSVKSLELRVEMAEQVEKQLAEERKEIEDAAVKAYQASQGPSNDPGFASGVAMHTRYTDISQYDNHSIGDLALASDLALACPTIRRRDPTVVKAMAIRLEQDTEEVKSDPAFFGTDQTTSLKVARFGMRQSFRERGLKADETLTSTNAGYGDEWIGVAYSGQLWESVRKDTFVVDKLNPFEFPAGAESITWPLESTDPTWYKVAQASGDLTAALAAITRTVYESPFATSSASMTLAKLGGATQWTGEMAEDSVLPFVSELRRKFSISGAEHLESAVIDGDDATTTTTNVNDIAGTPAGTEWFMVWDGFRVSPLVTTTANSRSGGTLTSDDFLETVKLMGTSGINGGDRSKVSFILDNMTHFKALTLDDVKTRDVFGGATIEGGMLTNIFGYPVDVSLQMCKASDARLSNSAGKVDLDATTNNTLGSILAVRWDQWKFAFRRRMTMEVERVPRADAWEITCLMRAALKQRDTEASAITYNITV